MALALILVLLQGVQWNLNGVYEQLEDWLISQIKLVMFFEDTALSFGLITIIRDDLKCVIGYGLPILPLLNENLGYK